MQIAVTGATGFLGRYIVSHLVPAGHSCRCWYRPGSDRGGCEAVERQVEWLPGELGDQEACDRLVEGCDAVVHAALYHPGSGAEITGTRTGPKHQIVTDKLRRLGMQFGGRPFLEQTIRWLLDAA
jgi:nucleoside-diphosphate-sugar epimerase